MKIHELDGYIQSIYLVEYSNKLLLLDSGCRCDTSLVRSFIEDRLQRSMADLKLVVVTHMHPDHGGGALVYQKHWNIPVASVDAKQQWYHGLRGSLQHLIDTCLALWVARRKGRSFRNLWYGKSLFPDKPVSHEDFLPGFDDWQVLETPGHTDRDLSLFHRESGYLYVGDMVLKLKGQFVSPVPVNFQESYRTSILYLSQLPYRTLLMAHGGMDTIDPADFMGLLENLESKPGDRDILVNMVKRRVARLLVRRKSSN